MNQEKEMKGTLENVLGEDFNFRLLKKVAKRSLIWVVLIITICVAMGFLYLRYTPAEFQASATLMLMPEKGTTIFDERNEWSNVGSEEIYSEIEIMKSQELMEKALSGIPLEVGYFRAGRIISDELYGNSPFEVITDNGKNNWIGKRFLIENVNGKEFTVKLEANEEEHTKKCQWGENCEIEGLNFKVLLKNEKANLEGLYFVMRNREQEIRRISREVNVALINPKSNKIKISFRDREAQRAVDIVNALADAFLKRDFDRKAESATLRMGFLDGQIDSLEKELLDQEEEIRKFKERNNIIDPTGEVQYLKTKLDELKKGSLELELELAHLEWLGQFVKDKENDISSIPPGFVTSQFSGFSFYLNELRSLETRRKELLLSVKETDPKVKMITDDIEKGRRSFEESIKNEKERIIRRREAVAGEVEESFREFSALPQLEAEYMRMKRIYDIKENVYVLLRAKRAEFGVAKAGFVSDYTILSEARGATKIAPRENLIKFGTGIVGLFIGFLFVVVRYVMHNTISSIKDIEAMTTAPVLGMLPRCKRKMEIAELVIDENPKSMIAEAFRSVRTNLQFIGGEKKGKTIGITSTVSGEGKTFVAINLGAIINLLEKKVVILDFDMRKPKLDKVFNLDNKKGISTILIGQNKAEECIFNTGVKELDVIPCGPIPPNPAELIHSKRTNELIETLKKTYDVIIIDTAPVGLVADALGLFKMVDVQVYMMRSGFSKREFVKNVNRLIEDNGIERMSLILNDVDMEESGYGRYGGGYGYGYLEKEDEGKWYKRLFNR